MAIGHQPCTEEMLLTGDFNANLAALEGNTHDEEISVELATVGLQDMITHFLTWRKMWLRDWRALIMLCRGREMRSCNDCILGID